MKVGLFLVVIITTAVADEAIGAISQLPPRTSEGGAAKDVKCMPFCNEEPCTAFNGNLTSECGACDSAVAKCYPGAEGFDTTAKHPSLGPRRRRDSVFRPHCWV